MNRIEFHPAQTANEYREEMNRQIQRNPTTSVLIALGAGFAAAILIRALRPEPEPTTRLSRLLEDIQDRLRETSPAIRRTGSRAAAEAAHVIRDSVHEGEARVERFLNQAGKRLRGLFS